jgi:predicted ATPase
VNIPNISTLSTISYPDIFKQKRIPFYIGLTYLPQYIFRKTCLGIDISRVYYLPPSRSGILQVWPLIGTYISDSLRALQRPIGLDPINIRRAPGVTFDFMNMLYNFFAFRYQYKKDNPAFNKIAKFMEADILGGQIDTPKSDKHRYPSFTYRSADLSIDVQRASSMIAELAPLDMLIKRTFEESGDLLIIDEPEAHLHPESQRKVALLLARLVKNGVNVLCTTHSHIFLHQLSNLVLASTTITKTRKRLDLEESYLNATDVGVYLYRSCHELGY